VIGQVDLLATFAELLGVKLSDTTGQDSQSFASVLVNPNADYDRLPLINHGFAGQFAITEGRWKLIFQFGQSGTELYDLVSDPAEKNNIANEHLAHVERLKKKATDIVLNGRTTPGTVQANDTGYWDHLTWITEKEYIVRQIVRKQK